MQKQLLRFAVIVSAVIFYSCRSHTVVPDSAEIKTDPPPVENDLALNEIFNLDSLHQLFSDLHTNYFTVSSGKVSVVTGAKGLRVTVDPSALETERGTPVKGNISVSIIELSDPKDFFRANTATVSDDRLLASGGSYYVGMKANGEKLRVKKGRSLCMDFPVLRKQEMELFYGERDATENMNWKKANIALTVAEKTDVIEFTDTNPYGFRDYLPGFATDTAGKARIFKTLEEKVYLNSEHITIRNLLDTVNKHELRLGIDTVTMWPVLATPLKPGQRIDTSFLLATYGPEKQFIIKSMKKKPVVEAKPPVEQPVSRPASLRDQLLSYYNPAKITTLGWINCDRFYEEKEQMQQELNIPIALRKNDIKYFLLLPAINGLLTGSGAVNETGNIMLPKLPRGEAVNFIGFIKSDGRIFQCKQSLITGSKEPISTEFEEVTAAELKQLFGANVRA